MSHWDKFIERALDKKKTDEKKKVEEYKDKLVKKEKDKK